MNVTNRFSVLLSTALLAACSSFSPDGGLNQVSDLTRARTGQSVLRESESSAADQQAQQEQIRQLLATPLTPDSAVQLALLNNKRLQSALADLGVAEADLVQAGTLRNPRFGFGRLAGNGETEIDRSVLLDLGGLLTMPLRKAIEQRRFNQAQLQAALQAVRLAADTRRAYFQAVAAKQSLGYMRRVGLAAESSAELAQRMAKAGNWSKLDEAREQIFHIEINTQIQRAIQNETTTRERLVRLLGLPDQQTPLTLPDRLPDLPAELNPAEQIEAKAIAQRLDVQIAKLETEATAKNLGLTRSTRFINVLEAGYENKSATGASRADGYVVELSLPLFDWGTARTRRAESIYMRSVQRTADIAVQARSEVRETYSAYRTSFAVSRQYRDEIVPLRKRISEEVLLRYNGMLASVFELLLDSRAQILSVNAAIDAQRDFWIADTELQFAINGGSMRAIPLPTSSAMEVGSTVGAAH